MPCQDFVVKFFSNKCVGASDLAGYFGKKSDMIVHHLAEMRSECHIHPVKNDDRTYFTPDTLDNAKNRGFIHVLIAVNVFVR